MTTLTVAQVLLFSGVLFVAFVFNNLSHRLCSCSAVAFLVLLKTTPRGKVGVALG